jgi:DNA polymerase III alpha subunit
MIALFKSTQSIGKSILTLNHPDKDKEDGADSIFSIAVDNKLTSLFLVEDSMIGFFEAFRTCKELGIQLIFGYRFTCCTNRENKESDHKLIVFAKNDQGCKDLNKFYSFINTECERRITNDELIAHLTDDLILAVPFYDSFIFNNHFCLGNCIPDFKQIQPIFFIENNGLPFDNLIAKAVGDFCLDHYKMVPAKSIYYRYKADYEALQAYKVICNRSFGEQATLSSPNLNHFGSDEFCWESYEEQQ